VLFRSTVADLAEIEPVHYEGVVWCLTVPTGAFVARRNGKVFVTGNSGFPKSHNVGKSTGAAEFDGWGTALKPAFEPIVLARKPFKGTVAKNVLAHGTGAINIDACRIGTEENLTREGSGHGMLRLHGCHTIDELRALAEAGEKTPDGRDARATLARAIAYHERVGEDVQPSGRWPANVLLDHNAAAWVDEQSGITKDGVAVNRNRDPEANKQAAIYGTYKNGRTDDVSY